MTPLARQAREAVGHGSLAISPKKKQIALGVAAIADVIQVVFWPAMAEGAVSPFEDVLDIAVAAILIYVLGFQWRLVFAFALELVPGLDLFPSWTAVVLSMPTAAPTVEALPENAGTAALPEKATPPRF
jgi:hypothetical protein